MATMPLDVLTANGIDPDKAITIWEELREKFNWTPIPRYFVDSDATEITVRADNNPMLWYIGTDQSAYRLDGGPFEPGSQGFVSGREAQLALALIDISAARVREVTR